MANPKHFSCLSEFETISVDDFRGNIQQHDDNYAEAANNFIAGSRRMLNALRRQSGAENLRFSCEEKIEGDHSMNSR